MEKEFVPYELAVKLKELGFDEPCFARFRKGMFQLNTLGKPHKYNSDEIVKEDVSAPLWQQSFDWFREKHNLHYGIRNDGTNNSWYLSRWGKRYETYLEARQACLEKLIELVENN